MNGWHVEYEKSDQVIRYKKAHKEEHERAKREAIQAGLCPHNKPKRSK